MYSAYCRNHPNATAKLTEFMKKTDFAQTIKVCESDPRSKFLNLAGFLIKPVQRICKYPILFRELMKNTTTPEQEQAINTLLEKIEEVTKSINEGAKVVSQRLLEIQNSLDGSIVKPNLIFSILNQ